jgi:uncharacterized protein
MLTFLPPYPAALIKGREKKTIVIADPHLGWEIALQEKGIHVPNQTSKLLKKLETLLIKHKPDALIIIGDVKYSVTPSKPGEWHDIPTFFTEIKNFVPEIRIVRGNHDANLERILPEDVEICSASGVIVENVGLFHGHKWPSPELLGCKTLIMGHLHPVVVFRDPAGFKITRQVWMRADCNSTALAHVLLEKQGIKIEKTVDETLNEIYGIDLNAKQIFVMPSFNDFLGGRPVNEKRTGKQLGGEPIIGPILRSEAIKVGDSEFYLLDGTYLGTLNHLRQLS